MKQTIEKLFCDNCKEEVKDMFNAHVRIQYQERMYTGDMGGCTVNYDLCGNCTQQLRTVFGTN